jgi:glycosyltransferase involved in cell wall biosynthesis
MVAAGENKMKKALIVSYVFPPMAAVGGQRIVNFCKFLPRYGWTPVVLTVKNGVNTSWDPEPLKTIPETIVYRTLTFEPILKREMRQKTKKDYSSDAASDKTSRRRLGLWSLLAQIRRILRLVLTVPDHAIFWVPLGLYKGLKAIKKEKAVVIFSSSPPVSAHILASILARLRGVPHIVDFRDLWTLNQNYELRRYPAVFEKYDRFWEKFVLKRAAHIIAASPGFALQLENHLNGRLKGKIDTLTNGFDYGEIDCDREFLRPNDSKLRFLYAGSLYGDFNPVFFLESLAQWVEKNPGNKASIQVDFYGNCEVDYSAFASKLGLGETVRFHGFVPRRELLPLYMQADCLLLFLGFRPQAKNVIPAKLFEYLASGIQILATAPKGPATELIDKYSAGFYICEPDREKMAAIIQKIYERHGDSLSVKRRYRYLADIDRARLTERLARKFDLFSRGKGR